jgi:pyrroloquinoline quinone biosynthesis protein A
MDVALMTMRLGPANACTAAERRSALTNYANPQGGDMNWTTPAYTELRLGFEITMYIANR